MSSLSLATKFQTPTPSGHTESDIIGWVKNGDCVILHRDLRCWTVFHNCTNQQRSNKDQVSTEDLRLIYINLGSRASLLNEDEWPTAFPLHGCNLCSCDLAKRIKSSAPDVPGPYGYSLSVKT